MDERFSPRRMKMSKPIYHRDKVFEIVSIHFDIGNIFSRKMFYIMGYEKMNNDFEKLKGYKKSRYARRTSKEVLDFNGYYIS